MNKGKFALLAGSILTVTQILSVAPASAATTPTRAPIYYNGKVISKPFYVTASDPNTHKSTSWLPLYYVQRTLNQMGLSNKWNGSSLSLTAGKGWTTNLKNLPASHSPAKGQMSIAINGKSVIYAPKLVSQDPYGHRETAYVPVAYMQQALNRLGVTVQWTASSLKLTR